MLLPRPSFRNQGYCSPSHDAAQRPPVCNLEEARQSFAVVVENFPNDRKAPDATFKLGKVYHLLGDNARARQLLTQVSAGASSAAKLAQAYLKENF